VSSRAGCVLVIIFVLAACVRAPQPALSPMTFSSPLPKPAYRVYLPLVTAAVNPKRGVSLACGYDDPVRLAHEVDELRVAWVWNWQTDPPLFPGVESVPCIWDGSKIGVPLGGNSQWVIGFNEPDDRAQANMTPAQAAREWRRIETTYPDRKLASPQVMVWGDRWLEEWYAAYQALYGRRPKIDAIAVHTYYGNSLAAYQEQVRYYIALAERWDIDEVWVTEFAIAPVLDRTLRQALDETTAYVAWLNAQPKVTRYAPWTNRIECMSNIIPDGIFDTPFYATNGQITEMGRRYIELVCAESSCNQ
jgi:hypothetical protein